MMGCGPAGSVGPDGSEYPRRVATDGSEGVTQVARHAASPPQRRPSPRDAQVLPATAAPRSRPAVLAAALVAAGGATFVALTVGAVAVSGVGFLPRGPVAAAAAPAVAPPLERVALATTPAQQAIAQVLGGRPDPSWVPVGSPTWTAATPFDEECGRPGELDAALAGARAYTVGRDQVLVSISSYSAGLGAPALAGWSSNLGECASSGRVGRVRVEGPGGSGILAWLRAGSTPGTAAMLMWRRGDVIATVAVPTAQPAGLAARAALVDTALVAALAGRCADTSSTGADSVRSPWVSRNQFTGLTEPLTVAVGAATAPVPPPGVIPVPDTWTPQPIPSVSLPARPADPVWPEVLPAPVVSPFAPAKPTRPPASTSVASRVDDPIGPGCGWAFTGQVRLPYDAGTEAALTQARAAQAEADLGALQAQWQSDAVAFWRDVPAYELQAQLFSAYAAEVSSVAVAWDALTRERERYAVLVDAYNAAVTARQDFLAAQAAARAQYEVAVSVCGSTPSPLPSPTEPSPSDTAVPTPTPTPIATDAVTPGCPPEVPAILFESPPELPPAPTPPSDPRPTP